MAKKNKKFKIKDVPKIFAQSIKHVWKKHGPTINPSTKNPKGIGKN